MSSITIMYVFYIYANGNYTTVSLYRDNEAPGGRAIRNKYPQLSRLPEHSALKILDISETLNFQNVSKEN